MERSPIGIEKLPEALSRISEIKLLRKVGFIQPASLMHDMQDLFTLELRLREVQRLVPSRRDRDIRERPLKVLPGTSWEDIEIRFLSEHQFQPFARGVALEPVGFEEAGFGDGRSSRETKPIAAWSKLIDFARKEGILSRPPFGTNRSQFEKLVSTIRAKLKALFRMNADPFHETEKGSYRLRPKIHFPPNRDIV